MDQVKSNFYENQILEAIETVATGIVSKMKFDQTILCTIINDERKDDGVYEVTDGTSTFTATSNDTTFSNDTSVYVLIPQGDHNNQKTIVGKYVDSSASAINYIPASESIIEIVNFNETKNTEESQWNRVNKWDPINKHWSLLTNKETLTTIPIYENNNWENNNIYTCASLKGKFKTNLSQYNMIRGDYGLTLTLGGYYIDENGVRQSVGPHTYIFNCSEMYGDPYNYNIFYEHDLVFDLTEFFKDVKINQIKISFYQNNNFIHLSDTEGEIPISSSYSVNGISADYPDNLFVKDIELGFGYMVNDIQEEGIKIYTPDNLKYEDRDSEKDLLLKYFIKNEIGNKTSYGIIDERDELNRLEDSDKYSIYWYRYKIGDQAPDPIAGAFWIPVQVFNNIEYYTDETNLNILNRPRYREDNTLYPFKIVQAGEDPFKYTFAPDKLLEREKIKAVLVYNDYTQSEYEEEVIFTDTSLYYESNEIEFQNSQPADPSLSSVDLIRNMRLECADGSNGIYKLYNGIDNTITNNEDTKERCLKVLFENYSSQDILKDEELCHIKWKLPKANTMLRPVNKTGFSTPVVVPKPVSETGEASISAESSEPITWISGTGEDTKYWICEYDWSYEGAGEDSVQMEAELQSWYSIDSLYSQSYTNNTIICEIFKYGKTYSAEINFTFGETGTGGTGYTLNLKLDKEVNGSGNDLTSTPVSCLTHNGNWVKVIATLLDEHGNDMTKDKSFSWGWLNEGSSYSSDSFELQALTSNTCQIKTKSGVSMDVCYGILSASVEGIWNGNSVTLTGYLPLGVKKNNNPLIYEGTTKMIYDNQGLNPIYQKEHCLRNLDFTPLDNVTWKVIILNSDSGEDWTNYAPYFSGKQDTSTKIYNLSARSLYFTELSTKKIVIQAKQNGDVIYSQSLYYNSNAYGNQMFNDWTGEMIIDKDNNKILAALIGAGVKETDNTFSGAVMGALTTTKDGSEETKKGLIGFDHSIEVFGFHTDGTAFIGAPDQGRIEFDGTQGIIKSYTGSTYFNLRDGMLYLSNDKMIDTDDNGEEQIVDNEVSARILLSSTGEDLNNTAVGFFEISANGYKDDKNETINHPSGYKPLIHIGEYEYYLQSSNYSEETENEYTYTDEITGATITTTLPVPGTGMKIDINNGHIIGYDFTLTAGNSDNKIIINSNDGYNPFMVGPNFRVSWDGTVTAYDGYFMGKITANSGTIGKWNIVENALYYEGEEEGAAITETTNTDNLDTYKKLTAFTVNEGSAIIVPEGGVSISGWTPFTNAEYSDGEVDPNTGNWKEGEEGKWTNDGTITELVGSNIVFAIGKNFVIDNTGTLYANGANLAGYVHSSSLPELSQDLIDIATGKVKAETDLRIEADDAEEEARIEADNGLNGKIGSVNLNTNGAITQLGTMGENIVFVDSTLASHSGDTPMKLVSGYYENGTFYKEEEEYIGKIQKDIYKKYKDIDTNKTYSVINKDASTLIYQEDSSIEIDDCYVLGYYHNEDFWQNKNFKKSNTELDKKATNIYVDLNTNKTYLYDNSSYRLTTPEDNIVIFMVSKDGLLQASNAVIGGTIYAHSGYIGGWTIQHITNSSGTNVGGITYGNVYSDENDKYQGEEGYPWVIGDKNANITPGDGLWIKNTTLFPAGNDGQYTLQCVLNIGKNFAVDNTGTLYATGGEFTGKISAETGTIGGWTVAKDCLYYIGSEETRSIQFNDDDTIFFPYGDSNMILAPKGNVYLFSDTETADTAVVLNIGSNFAINEDGCVNAENGSFSGTINADKGEIGGWTISSESPLSNSSSIYGSIYNISQSDSDSPKYMLGLQASSNSNFLALFIKQFDKGATDYLDSGATPGTNKFYIKYNGEVFASNLTISGDFSINGKSNTTEYLGFKADSQGNIFARQAYFCGDLSKSITDLLVDNENSLNPSTLYINQGQIQLYGRWIAHNAQSGGRAKAGIVTTGKYGYHILASLGDNVLDDYADTLKVSWDIGTDGYSDDFRHQFVISHCQHEGSYPPFVKYIFENQVDRKADASILYKSSFYGTIPSGFTGIVDLGRSDSRWDTIYTKNLNMTGNLSLDSLTVKNGTTIYFEANSTEIRCYNSLQMNNSIWCNGHNIHLEGGDIYLGDGDLHSTASATYFYSTATGQSYQSIYANDFYYYDGGFTSVKNEINALKQAIAALK